MVNVRTGSGISASANENSMRRNTEAIKTMISVSACSFPLLMASLLSLFSSSRLCSGAVAIGLKSTDLRSRLGDTETRAGAATTGESSPLSHSAAPWLVPPLLPSSVRQNRESRVSQCHLCRQQHCAPLSFFTAMPGSACCPPRRAPTPQPPKRGHASAAIQAVAPHGCRFHLTAMAHRWLTLGASWLQAAASGSAPCHHGCWPVCFARFVVALPAGHGGSFATLPRLPVAQCECRQLLFGNGGMPNIHSGVMKVAGRWPLFTFALHFSALPAMDFLHTCCTAGMPQPWPPPSLGLPRHSLQEESERESLGRLPILKNWVTRMVGHESSTLATMAHCAMGTTPRPAFPFPGHWDNHTAQHPPVSCLPHRKAPPSRH